MEQGLIQGIQHIGIGVPHHEEAWKWYRKFFGMDVPFFNAEGLADLMTIYTEGEVVNKRAAMVMNLKGGAAMEVVQPITFKATHASIDFQLGDLGIFVGAFKAPDVVKAYDFFQENGAEVISPILKTPAGWETFYVKDPNGLLVQVLPASDWYSNYNHVTGGTVSCTIGCTDIEASRKLYSDILGYDEVVYDETGVFQDWENLPGGKGTFRRVLLKRSKHRTGGFNKLSGETYIELMQELSDRTKHKMYENRKWGDIGYVHLGFDVRGMEAIGKQLDQAGFGFTCDTKNVLSMGESTKVHCTYIEDPDGTLIEMIEVYKIPILEKLRIYLNVAKRHPDKPLPDTMLKAMRFMRIKD